MNQRREQSMRYITSRRAGGVHHKYSRIWIQTREGLKLMNLRKVFMKNDPAHNKMDKLIKNIVGDKFISFSDEEIPKEPGIVPSTLHKRLKFVIDDQLVTVSIEVDIIALCTKVQVKETLRKGIGIGRSFGKQYQWRLFPITIAEKKDQFGLGFYPGSLQIRLQIRKRFVNPDVTRVKKEGKNDLDKMLEGLDINDVTDVEEGSRYMSRICPCSELNNWIVEEIHVDFKSFTK
ncbi:hypothetical protein GQ457_05G027610 [Hibiscus cannabinus]